MNIHLFPLCYPLADFQDDLPRFFVISWDNLFSVFYRDVERLSRLLLGYGNFLSTSREWGWGGGVGYSVFPEIWGLLRGRGGVSLV